MMNPLSDISSGKFGQKTGDNMISFDKAYRIVLDHPGDFGIEQVDLSEAGNRFLAKNIIADRDYPPFDRATKDGIALRYKDANKNTPLVIKGIVAAGTPRQKLPKGQNCMEIMTGAVVPLNADTVVMYEDIDVSSGQAHLNKQPEKGQNIHLKGSDDNKGALLISAGKRIGASEIGIMATVGKSSVEVKKLPSVAVVSTGNELVDIDKEPLPHQIRRSNAYTLRAALSVQNITPSLHHLPDDPQMIRNQLQELVRSQDVLILSGGVSMGKFDYIPKILAELKVDKLFHRVKQRPGKPFWFGRHNDYNTWVFSFPGNPVSTFINHHIYFNDWLRASLGLAQQQFNVILKEELMIQGSLTRFIGVKTVWDNGKLLASTVKSNSSGDLISLASYDGFIRLDPQKHPYKKDEAVSFIPTRLY